MPTYLSPGVYVEEVESGSRPIEGVGTAVAAFVGLAERGPVDEPTLVTSWAQFTKNFRANRFLQRAAMWKADISWLSNLFKLAT